MTHKELVERLAITFYGAYAPQHGRGFVVDEGIRAVLAELAKMGAGELPSTDDIMRAWWSHDGPRGRDSAAIEHGVYNMLCSRVAPILAAKDAELARQADEIERLRADAAPTDEQLADEAARFVYGLDWWDSATDGQRDNATRAARHIIRGGDDRSVFGTEVRIYAEGARRAGRASS